MKLQKDCVACIIGQAEKVAEKIGANKALTEKIHTLAKTRSTSFSHTLTPPEVATPLYEEMAQLAQKADLYKEVKLQATKEAKLHLPQLIEFVQKSKEPLHTAVKIAVAGNVIDLASHHEFTIEEEVANILEATFGIDDTQELVQKLATANRVLYLADNAGEHIFDSVLLQVVRQHFPKMTIDYLTRGNAIINDVTLQEAKADGLDQWARLGSSGMKTPGFIYDNASPEIQTLFMDADVVIAKGMGNFETMTEFHHREVFHLFKVKCSVVAEFVGHTIGSFMVLKR